MASITVTGLGKAYRQYPSRWGRLAEWLLPGSRPRHQLHWVLRDISFHVEPGQALGIIGVNGAGKSTLLKMIAGTSVPTVGAVHTQGQVAALLELGMGFHPEFTGRQNAVMAAQLLGYSRADIEALMPEIEAFAEIGAYIDQPLRVYSSGMQMRLAFSVAVARRPDVLIVDEALSVGDVAFQHKSLERIRAFRDEGTTLLMVSHDRLAIQSICDRALLLSNGTVAMEGDPEAVMDYYNALLADPDGSQVTQTDRGDGRMQTRSGNNAATVASVALQDKHGKSVDLVGVGEPVSLALTVQINEPLPRLVCGFTLKDRLGQPLFGTNTAHLGLELADLQPGQQVSLRFDFPANLGEGEYSIATALHGDESHINANYEWLDLALLFRVLNRDHGVFVGVNWLPTQVHRVDEKAESTHAGLKLAQPHIAAAHE